MKQLLARKKGSGPDFPVINLQNNYGGPFSWGHRGGPNYREFKVPIGRILAARLIYENILLPSKIGIR